MSSGRCSQGPARQRGHRARGGNLPAGTAAAGAGTGGAQGDDGGDDERDDARSGGRDRRGRRGGDGCRCGAGDRLRALCQQARSQLGAGDGASAVASARRAVELLPRGLEGQRLLGLSLLATGDTRPALGAFQTALAGDPLDVVAQAGVATAQEQIGGPASAEAEWLRTWELSPGLAPVEARLQQAREAAGAPAMPAGREPYPFTTAAGPGLPQRGPQRARRGRGAGRPDPPARTGRPAPDPGGGVLAGRRRRLRGGPGRAPPGAPAGLRRRHLLLAPAGRRWGAIRPLLSRVRAVDPAGDVATRLFGDREAPPPWTASRAPAGPSRPSSPARPPGPAVPPAPAPGAPPAPAPEAPPAPEAVAAAPLSLSLSLRWRRYRPRRQTAPDPGGAPGAPANARPPALLASPALRAPPSPARWPPPPAGRGHQRPPNREPARPQRAGQRPGRRPRGGGRAGPPPAPLQHLSQVTGLASSAPAPETAPRPPPRPPPHQPRAGAPPPAPAPAPAPPEPPAAPPPRSATPHPPRPRNRRHTSRA